MTFMNWSRSEYRVSRTTTSIQSINDDTHEEIDPEVECVRSVEGGAADEPFRAEGHPPARQRDELIYAAISLNHDAYPPYISDVLRTIIQ